MADLPVVDLMKLMPDGNPAVSSYSEFLKLTGAEDNGDTFQAWLLAAACLMLPPGNRVPS